MKAKILLIAITAMLASCKPIKEIQYLDRFREVVKVDSVYKFQKDTVFSVKIGDTVYVNRVKTLIDYKYKFIAKTDTATKIETKIETVTEIKKISVTPKWAWYLLAFSVLFFAIKYRKLFGIRI